MEFNYNQLKKIKWQRFFSRGHHPLFYVDSVMIAHRDFFDYYFDLPAITFWARHSGSLWVDELNMKDIKGAIREKLYSKWPILIIRKMFDDLLVLNKFISKNKTKFTQKHLTQLFKLMYQAWLSTYIPIIIGEVIEEEILKSSHDLSEEDRQLISKTLNTPFYPIERDKYLFYLSKIKSIEKIKNVYTNIVHNFGWLNSYIMDIRPLTLKQVMYDWKVCRSGYKKGSSNLYKTKNKNLSYLINLGRRYCWFRDWRLFQINKVYYQLKSFLIFYGTNIGLDYNQIRQLKVSEFLTKRFVSSVIYHRQKEFSIILAKNKIKVLTGSDLCRVKNIISEQLDKTDNIYGLIGYKGMVTGKVKIANAYSFNKIEKGDILITPETTPDAVPYLKKVKAIVTDEGGITSHAAIVSRELKIPCIIGTKVATLVFKDGDMVEVDANRGIVRKL